MTFFLTLLLLQVLAIVYPNILKEDNKTIITADIYSDNAVIYEGKHDIVDILVPLNRITELDSYESSSSEVDNFSMFFFVEADINGDSREEQGIYVYKYGKVIKLMDKGRAIAAAADYSMYVYLGAEDGLYIYRPNTHKADKYGNFNNSIKDMAKEQNTDVIYILTDDRVLYEVYDAATKKVKIDDVKEAEQIMIDYSNNLFYYDNNKKAYVRTVDGEIKIIEDLPEGVHELKLIRPEMFNNEGVELIVDNELYTIYPNGTSKAGSIQFRANAKPTAYSMEASIFHYIGYKKKIYKYFFYLLEDFHAIRR